MTLIHIPLLIFFIPIIVLSDVAFVQTSGSDAAILSQLEPVSLDQNSIDVSCLLNKCQELDPDDLLRSLRVSPSDVIDFGIQRLGVPVIRTIEITNENKDELVINLLSISIGPFGVDCGLFASFFNKKSIKYGEKAEFKVVYLPKKADVSFATSVDIHTNLGSLEISVSGSAEDNEFYLRPIINAKVPVNTTYTSNITMRNPYGHPLRIVELYSSGNGFHLALPEQVDDTTRAWVLAPYETKTVMRTNFFCQEAMNHTGFLKITLSCQDRFDQVVLPLEFEARAEWFSLHPGIYCDQETIDFGQLLSDDEPKKIDLFLINTHAKDMNITSIHSRNQAVSINFKPLTLASSLGRFIKVATLVYDPRVLQSAKHCCGEIVIKSGDQIEMKLPFRARVLLGSLQLKNSQPLNFFSGTREPYQEDIEVVNSFEVPLMVSQVSVNKTTAPDFSVVGFSRSVHLKPGESSKIGSLRFTPSDPESTYSTSLAVTTNITTFHLPVNCFSGQLQYATECEEPDEEDLNFGVMVADSTKTLSVIFINRNAIPIDITEVKWTLEDTSVFLVGIESYSEGQTIFNKSHEPRELVKGRSAFSVPPGNFSRLNVTVRAPDAEEFRGGHLIVKSKYQTLRIQMHFQTAVGRVVSEPLSFRSFPYKTDKKEFRIQNAFKHNLNITSARFEPDDARFSFVTKGRGVARHGQKSTVGSIHFNPLATCHPKCYLGLHAHSSEAEQWISSLQLPHDVADIDYGHLRVLSQRWASVMETLQQTVNVTAYMDSHPLNDLIRMPIQAKLVWPSLVRSSGNLLADMETFAFPLTHVGSHSTKKIEVRNPADVPVIVQILPLSLYQNFKKILPLIFSNDVDFALDQLERTGDDAGLFYLKNSEENNKAPNNPSIQYRASLESKLDVKPSRQALTFILQPGMALNINVGFFARDDSLRSTLFIIRNNLTIVDVAQVTAIGAHVNFTVDGQPPTEPDDSSQPTAIPFELKTKYLEEHCTLARPYKVKKRRVLILENTGQLPITLLKADIAGSEGECGGRGFVIEECTHLPIRVPTGNKTHITITYHPDFSVSKAEAFLSLVTDMEPQSPKMFRLMATVPYTMMSKCIAAVPRPPWEGYLYYAVVLCMIVMFFGILVTSYLDATRLVDYSGFSDPNSANCSSAEPVLLDLRKVQQEVQSELRKRREETVEKPVREPFVPPDFQRLVEPTLQERFVSIIRFTVYLLAPFKTAGKSVLNFGFQCSSLLKLLFRQSYGQKRPVKCDNSRKVSTEETAVISKNAVANNNHSNTKVQSKLKRRTAKVDRRRNIINEDQSLSDHYQKEPTTNRNPVKGEKGGRGSRSPSAAGDTLRPVSSTSSGRSSVKNSPKAAGSTAGGRGATVPLKSPTWSSSDAGGADSDDSNNNTKRGGGGGNHSKKTANRRNSDRPTRYTTAPTHYGSDERLHSNRQRSSSRDDREFQECAVTARKKKLLSHNTKQAAATVNTTVAPNPAPKPVRLLQKKSATIGGTRDTSDTFYALGAHANLSRASSGSSLSDFSSSLATPEGLLNFRKAKEEFQRGALPTSSLATSSRAAGQKTVPPPARSPPAVSPQPIGSNLRKTSLQESGSPVDRTPFVYNRDPFLPGSNIGEVLFSRSANAHMSAFDQEKVFLRPKKPESPPVIGASPWLEENLFAGPPTEIKPATPEVTSAVTHDTVATSQASVSPIWLEPTFLQDNEKSSTLAHGDSVWATRLVSPHQPLIQKENLASLDKKDMSSIWERTPSPVGSQPMSQPPPLYDSFASASITDLWNPTSSIFPGTETSAWAEYQKRKQSNLPIAPFEEQ